MATARFTIKQGDTLPVLSLSLVSEQGTPYSLSGNAVVTLNYKHQESGATFIRPMTVTNAASGLVSYAWAAGDTAIAGVYDAEVQVVDSGTTWTYPGGGRYFALHVPPQLDTNPTEDPVVTPPAVGDLISIFRGGAELKAEIGSLAMRQAMGLADSGGHLPADMLPNTVGENFILVPLTSDPLQNGQNLIAACTQAASMTPNGLVQIPSAYGNRIQILLLPGRYDMGATGYVNLPSGVDLVGMARDCLQVWICTNNTADNYVLLNANGYNRIAGVAFYVNEAGVTINAETTDRHAAIYSSSGSGVSFYDCMLVGSNTLTPASTGIGTRFERCSLPQGFRQVTLSSFIFIDCFGNTMPGSQLNNHQMVLVGCRFMSYTTFIRCYVLVVDHQTTTGGRFINCPYVGYSMSSTFTGNMYVYSNHSDCGEITFLVSSGVTTTGRFMVKGSFRNCRILETTHITFQSAKFLHCYITDYSNNPDRSPVQYAAGVTVVFIQCSIHRTSGQATMLFSPATDTGAKVAFEHCSLPSTFALTNLTLVSGATLAEAFNFLMPVAEPYSRLVYT